MRVAPWLLVGAMAWSTPALADEAPAPSPAPAPAPKPAPGKSAQPPPDEAGRAGYREDLEETEWRKRSREQRYRKRRPTVDPTHFLFELRFGPYWPNVDDEFGGNGPYTAFFGDDPLFYFGVEADWLPFYIPYVASIGPAVGWGYTQASGNAKTIDGGEAATDTALMMFPMHVSGAIRFDGMLREWGVPVVPYAKVGFGIGLWTASGPIDTSEVNGEVGEGTSLGLHTAFGLSVALNFLDRTSAAQLREGSGVRYAHLFGEYMGNRLGTGDQMQIGTDTVVVGLGLEL